MTPAPVVAICEYPVDPDVLLRSILKPVSLFELSVQLKLMLVLVVAVDARPEGAAGIVIGGACVAVHCCVLW